MFVEGVLVDRVVESRADFARVLDAARPQLRQPPRSDKLARED